MTYITDFCRQLRKNQTLAEKVLWEEIRKRRLSEMKFLRQFPIFIVQPMGNKLWYIADFYCAKLKLVIEVDGPIHQFKKLYDDNRDAVMHEWGFAILRFTNDEVIRNVNRVCEAIEDYVKTHSKQQS